MASDAPTPTTPATAEQLREDAAHYRRRARAAAYAADAFDEPLYLCDEARYTRAAAALDAEAARMEAGATRPFSLWSRLRTLCAEAAAVDVNGTDYESFSAKLDELARQADDDIVATGLFVTGQLAPKTPATPHAELRGWGVMRPDGTIDGSFWHNGPHESEKCARRAVANYAGYRAVPVRLTTEGAE